MPHVDRAAELDVPQHQRERHGGQRDQHQHPEGVHVTQERGLGLDLLADPLNGLIMRSSRLIKRMNSSPARSRPLGVIGNAADIVGV